MAPSKSRSDSFTDKKTTSSSSSMKQGRLSFTASKLRAAGKAGKKGTESPKLILSRQVSLQEDEYSSSESEDGPKAIIARNITKPRELTAKLKAEVLDGGVPDVSEDIPRGDLFALDKKKKFNKIHSDSRNRMGGMKVGE